jgi:hypothetical protein
VESRFRALYTRDLTAASEIFSARLISLADLPAILQKILRSVAALVDTEVAQVLTPVHSCGLQLFRDYE